MRNRLLLKWFYVTKQPVDICKTSVFSHQMFHFFSLNVILPAEHHKLFLSGVSWLRIIYSGAHTCRVLLSFNSLWRAKQCNSESGGTKLFSGLWGVRGWLCGSLSPKNQPTEKQTSKSWLKEMDATCLFWSMDWNSESKSRSHPVFTSKNWFVCF